MTDNDYMGSYKYILAVVRAFGRLSFFLMVTLVAQATAGSMKFSSENGLVMVPVWLDNRVEGSFGIDTGADRLYIDSSFAAENRIDFETEGHRYNVYGIDGFSGAYETELKWFELGDERITGQPATVINMRRMSRSDQGIPDGLIGRDVLSQFYVTIDYARGRLDLDKYRPQFVSGKRYRELSFESHNHLILLKVTLNDSIVVPMILDYGASVTSVSPELAGRLGLNVTEGEVGRLGSVAIDDESRIAQVPVAVVDYSTYRDNLKNAAFEGILGATYLEHFVVSVDYDRNVIFIVED